MIKDTILYNQTSFDEQRKQFEKYGNKRLFGKDSLVDFLIDYRDSLKEITDNLAKTLQ